MTDPVYGYRIYEDDRDMWEVFKTDEDGEDLVAYVVTEATAKRLADGCNADMGATFVWIAVASGGYGTNEVSAVFSREEMVFPWVIEHFNRIREIWEEGPIDEDGLWGHDDGVAMLYTDGDGDDSVRVSRMPVLS